MSLSGFFGAIAILDFSFWRDAPWVLTTSALEEASLVGLDGAIVHPTQNERITSQKSPTHSRRSGVPPTAGPVYRRPQVLHSSVFLCYAARDFRHEFIVTRIATEENQALIGLSGDCEI
jgi:hypothetical protein